MMKKLIIISVSILFFCSGASYAKKKDTTFIPSARNMIYAEAAGVHILLVYSYFVSLNYERIIDDRLSIRIGYGFSEFDGCSFGGGCDYDAFHGPSVMINIHSTGNKKINIGFGVGYINNIDKPKEWKLFPALCITYRYQPLSGGIYFSIGMTVAYGGGGISLSMGNVF